MAAQLVASRAVLSSTELVSLHFLNAVGMYDLLLSLCEFLRLSELSFTLLQLFLQTLNLKIFVT
jgi:hypothetical protein